MSERIHAKTDIIAFFETEEGNREYEEWKQQIEKENQTNHKNIA